MENGEVFLEKIHLLNKSNIVLVGEPFYIQLFLNYNLLQLESVKIANIALLVPESTLNYLKHRNN